mgnify:CR=1 FL=1
MSLQPEFTLKLDDFAGKWTLRRKIQSDLGPDATLEGEAEFTPHDGGLRLTESGLLQMEGQNQSLNAVQTYHWYRSGLDILVRFNDGKFFHSFVPERQAHAKHWCAPDQYDVKYDFARWPVWQSEWTVKGPRKSYVMVSTYERLDVSPGIVS